MSYSRILSKTYNNIDYTSKKPTSYSRILSKTNNPKNEQQQPTDYNKGGLLGGLKYVGGKAGTGAFSVFEGAWDYVAGGISSTFGDGDYAKHLMENDISGRWNENLDEEYNPNKAMQFIGDVAGGLGQSSVGLATAAAITLASGGTLAPMAAGLVAGGTIGLGAAGQSTSQAYKKTGELGAKEYLYGGASGLLEGGLEALTGAAGSTAKRIASPLAKNVAKNALRKGVVKTMLSDGAGEFVEEALSEMIDPYLQRLTGVDKEAQNATMQQVLYAGMVGFTSGALMGGISTSAGNAKSAIRGTKIANEGNTELVLEKANELRDYTKKAENQDLVAKPLQSLKASLDAYDKVKNKDNIHGKMLLGEVAKTLSYVETSIGVQASKNDIVANADVLAEVLKKQGQNITAEDIVSNKNDIANKLAIQEFAGKSIIPAEQYTEMVKQGQMQMNEAKFVKWQDSLDEKTQKGLNSIYGIDVKNATFYDMQEAVKNYNPDKVQDLPDTLHLRNNEQKTYRINDISVHIKKTDKGYIVSAKDKSGQSLGGTTKPINESKLIEIIKEIKKPDFAQKAKEKQAEKKRGRTKKEDVKKDKFSLKGETKKESKIINKDGKKILKIELNTEAQKAFDNASQRERQKLAEKYIKEHFRDKEYKTTDGKIVVVTATGADKISHTKNEIKIKLSTELDKLLSIGKFVKNISVNHKRFNQFDYYKASFEIAGTEYTCRLNIGINLKYKLAQLYDINAINEKSSLPKTESPNLANKSAKGESDDTTINIRNNTENVNTKTEKSQENIKKDALSEEKLQIKDAKKRLALKQADTKGREYIKNYDMLPSEIKGKVQEAILSGKQYGIDERTLNGVCNIIAIRNIGVSFANIRQNGIYTSKKDKNGNLQRRAIINPNTNVIKETIIHELTHDMESTKGYEKLKNKALYYVPKAKQEAKKKQYEEYYKQIGKEIDQDIINSETTADFAAQEMNKRSFLDKYVNEDLSYFQKAKKWINSLVNSLKGSKSMALIEAKKVEVLYNYMVKNKSIKDVGNGIKYSLEKSFEEQVDQVINGTFPKEIRYLYMGTTPKSLIEKLKGVKSIKELPMLMPYVKAYGAIFSKGKENISNYHNLGAELLKQIPQAIKTPIYVFEGQKDNKIEMFVNLRDGKGDIVLIPIELESKSQSGNAWINANVIVTAYGKKKAINYINALKNNNRLLFEDKKMSQSLQVISRGQFPSDVNSDSSTINIRNNSENVNSKNEKISNNAEKVEKTIRYSLEKSFEEQVDDVFNGKHPKGQMVMVGQSPKYLSAIGFEQLPLLITQRHILNMNKSKDINYDNFHGLSKTLIKKLPKLIKNPVMVLKSFTKPNKSIVLVLNAIDKDKLPIIAAIENNGYGYYKFQQIDANILSSAYGKDNFNRFLEKAVNRNSIIYANKEKSQKLLDSIGLQLPKVLKTFNFNTIIFKYDKKSKSFHKINENKIEKYSLSTDSNGKTLTKEQQEFFKDSKVRDEQGRLLEVYHGTNDTFYKVDFAKGSQGLFWFSDSKKHIQRGESGAGGTKKIMSLYANIKNPAGWEEYDKYGISELEYKGYDGVLLKEENQPLVGFVFTNPTQIKLTTNLNPTENEDIRYSLPKNINISKQEYAILRKEVVRKNANNKSGIRPIDTACTANNFYVYENYGDDTFKAIERLKIVGNEDFIEQLEGEIENGIITNTKTTNTYIKKFRNGQRSNNRNNVDASRGRTNDTIGGLYRDKSKSDTIGDIEESSRTLGRTSKYNSRGITKKYSLPENATQVLTQIPEELKKTKKEVIKDQSVAAQIKFVNAQAGIEKEGKKLGIKDIDNFVQACRAARSAGQEMLSGTQFDIRGNKKVGNGLQKIFNPIIKKGDEYTNDFFKYLLAKHNLDRIKYNKPATNWGKEETQKIIEYFESASPEFINISQELYKYQDNLLQIRVDSDLISQEHADTLRKMYPNYIPTFRDVEKLLGTGAITGKHNLAVKQTIKKLKENGGSELSVLPIHISVGRQTLETIGAAKVNMLANALYDGAIKNNDFSAIDIIEKDKLSMEEQADIDYSDYRPKNNEITFFRNGERMVMKVSKEIFAGFEALSPTAEIKDPFINITRKINASFKKLVTSYNPAFLLRNMLRDIQDAGMYSKYLKSFPKNYIKAMNQIKNNGEYWQRYRAIGGLNNSIFEIDKGFIGEQNKWGLTKPEGHLLNKSLQKMENINVFIEQLPRLAEFISSLEAGNTTEQALLDAADITTNFGRTGTITKRFNSTLIPFLNPAIQGFSKLIRTITSARTGKEITALLVKVAILGILPQLFNQLMYDDDEDYKNLNDSYKENYYLFKIGDKFLRIPKGRVSTLFAGATMRVGQIAKGEEADWKGYVDNALNQVTPVDSMSRTIFSPFKDIATNTTWYGGTIEGRQFEDVEPKQRYDESTSSIAVKMGKVLNYSPKKIHYMLDQYSGVIGDFILPATTKKAEKDFISGNFIVDPVTQNRLSSKFYEKYDELNYAKTSGDETAKYQIKYLNKVKSAVSGLYSEKRLIDNNEELSDKEKRAQTRTIQILINEAYKTAMADLPTMTKAIETTKGLEDNIRYTEATRLVYGAERALREYNKDVYSKAQTLNKGGIDYENYYQTYFTIKDIESDKDQTTGATIAGSKKVKVIKYINTLKLSREQKALMIYANGYTIQDGDIRGATSKDMKKLVANYINKQSLSIEDKTLLAQLCGFTVKNNRILID